MIIYTFMFIYISLGFHILDFMTCILLLFLLPVCKKLFLVITDFQVLIYFNIHSSSTRKTSPIAILILIVNFF